MFVLYSAHHNSVLLIAVNDKHTFKTKLQNKSQKPAEKLWICIKNNVITKLITCPQKYEQTHLIKTKHNK